jgi:nitrate/nitrite transporter NarK
MYSPSYALSIGLFVAIFSLISIIALVSLDGWYDSQNNSSLNNQSSIDNDNDNIEFSDIKNLSYIFWLLVAICVFLYGGFIPFNNIAAGFITNTYLINMSKIDATNKAGMYMAIPFTIGIFFVPFYGYLIDKIGERAYMSLAASCSGLMVFTLLYVCSPIIPLILLGLTYSLFASLIWPSMAIVVPKQMTGIAFGIATSVQNFGLAIFPLLVATILTNTGNNYNYVSFFNIHIFIYFKNYFKK